MIAKVDIERALLDFCIPGEPQQKTKRHRKRRMDPDLRSGRPKIHSKQRNRRKEMIVWRFRLNPTNTLNSISTFKHRNRSKYERDNKY